MDITIKLLHKEVFATARVVPSVQGGGVHGHLGHIMTAVEYARLAVPFSYSQPIRAMRPSMVPIQRHFRLLRLYPCSTPTWRKFVCPRKSKPKSRHSYLRLSTHSNSGRQVGIRQGFCCCHLSLSYYKLQYTHTC